jgi:hypothetical protein
MDSRLARLEGIGWEICMSQARNNASNSATNGTYAWLDNTVIEKVGTGSQKSGKPWLHPQQPLQRTSRRPRQSVRPVQSSITIIVPHSKQPLVFAERAAHFANTIHDGTSSILDAVKNAGEQTLRLFFCWILCHWNEWNFALTNSHWSKMQPEKETQPALGQIRGARRWVLRIEGLYSVPLEQATVLGDSVRLARRMVAVALHTHTESIGKTSSSQHRQNGKSGNASFGFRQA